MQFQHSAPRSATGANAVPVRPFSGGSSMQATPPQPVQFGGQLGTPPPPPPDYAESMRPPPGIYGRDDHGFQHRLSPSHSAGAEYAAPGPSGMEQPPPPPPPPPPEQCSGGSVLVWSEHQSPMGVPYYYCQETHESRWIRPSSARDVVLPNGIQAPRSSGRPTANALSESGSAPKEVGASSTSVPIGQAMPNQAGGGTAATGSVSSANGHNQLPAFSSLVEAPASDGASVTLGRVGGQGPSTFAPLAGSPTGIHLPALPQVPGISAAGGEPTKPIVSLPVAPGNFPGFPPGSAPGAPPGMFPFALPPLNPPSLSMFPPPLHLLKGLPPPFPTPFLSIPGALPGAARLQFSADQMSVENRSQADPQRSNEIGESAAVKPDDSTIGSPESWESLGETPWYRVETSTGLMYFFNKKTKEALWTCPDAVRDIVGQLDGLEPPDESQTNDAETKGAEEIAAEVHESDESQEDNSGSSSESESEDEEVKTLRAQMENMQSFKQLIREKKFGTFSSYEKCLPKLVYESRFTVIPANQRKRLFERFMKEISEEQRRSRTEHVEAFQSLLDEAAKEDHLHATSTVESLSKRYGADNRWHGSGMEGWEAIRQTLIKDRVRHRRQCKDSERAAARKAFRDFVRSKLADSIAGEWDAIRRQLREDPLYQALGSATERARIFKEVCMEIVQRAAANRKRRDDREAGGELEDMDVKRKKLHKSDAEAAFRTMLTERVKNPWSWAANNEKEATQLPLDLLQSDPRYSSSNLNDEDKARLYAEFLEELKKLRLDYFEKKLTLLKPDMINIPFKEVLASADTSKKLFEDFPKAHLEAAHQKWRQQVLGDAKEAYIHWLKQVPDITHESEVHGPKFEQLLGKLSKDVRFQRLESIAEERRELVANRIREVTKEHAALRGKGDVFNRS
eukprot:GHVT01097604.1.p1 GENE.GHVT01097604.1~~GHVT01097604.1.p1  ORF type:complete len:909 (+),score=110.66 GHVT01097604.1:508-3234(+)